MIRVALRGLLARKLRSVLTAAAVLLGVAMIAGTFIYTDTVDKAFESIFTDAAVGSDVVVSGKQSVSSNFAEPPSLSDALVARIARLPGVKDLEGQVADRAAVVGSDGKLVSTAGAPTLSLSVMRPPFEALTAEKGRLPRGPGEVGLDAGTVEDEGFEIGDMVTIATDRPKKRFRLAGTVRYGEADIGTTLVAFDKATAQELFLKRGKVDFLSVSVEPGTSPQELVARIKPLLREDQQVLTTEDQVANNVDDLGEQLKFLDYGLVGFGFIALFVGAFVIFNTFSITVAQRTREFAVLRTLGATRRQVLGSVIFEALLIGLLASLAGLVSGYALAAGLNALFEAIGARLPTTDLVVTTRTVVVSLLVGVLVTLVASLAPAFRATRVAPMEALHQGSGAPARARAGRRLPIAGGVIVLLGTVLMALGLLGEGNATARLLSSAGGTIVLIIGVALLSPRLVRPVAAAAGWPLERATALVGRLARENTGRNPGRTAVTAAALMIGLSLVLFVTVFANGLRESIAGVIDRTFAGDVLIVHDDGFSPIPAATAKAVRRVPQVEIVSALRFDDSGTRMNAKADKVNANGVDPATIREVYNFDWKDGSDEAVDRLSSGGMLLEEEVAEKSGYDVGDTVDLRTPTGRKGRFEVVGVYRDDGLLGGFAISPDEFQKLYPGKRIATAFANLKPGADKDAAQAGIDRALASFPEARPRSQQEIKEENEEQVNQILALLYGLLAMSVIVSLFGIVNTLTLSIYERTRELGLLRAVGMSRRQIRRMIRYESVITCAIGGTLGLVLGLFFAWIVTRALADEGIVFAIPWAQLVVFMAVALLAGVFAAVPPARRASRLDVLEAIAYE